MHIQAFAIFSYWSVVSQIFAIESIRDSSHNPNLDHQTIVIISNFKRHETKDACIIL